MSYGENTCVRWALFRLSYSVAGREFDVNEAMIDIN